MRCRASASGHSKPSDVAANSGEILVQRQGPVRWQILPARMLLRRLRDVLCVVLLSAVDELLLGMVTSSQFQHKLYRNLPKLQIVVAVYVHV